MDEIYADSLVQLNPQFSSLNSVEKQILHLIELLTKVTKVHLSVCNKDYVDSVRAYIHTQVPQLVDDSLIVMVAPSSSVYAGNGEPVFVKDSLSDALKTVYFNHDYFRELDAAVYDSMYSVQHVTRNRKLVSNMLCSDGHGTVIISDMALAWFRSTCSGALRVTENSGLPYFVEDMVSQVDSVEAIRLLSAELHAPYVVVIPTPRISLSSPDITDILSFVDDTTIALTKLDTMWKDQGLPDYGVFEQVEHIVRSMTNLSGKSYRILELPIALVRSGAHTHPTFDFRENARFYTNTLRIGSTLFVADYTGGGGSTDSISHYVQSLFNKAFPSDTVVPVPMLEAVELCRMYDIGPQYGSGGLTTLVGKCYESCHVALTQNAQFLVDSSSVHMHCEITSLNSVGFDHTILFYRIRGDSLWHSSEAKAIPSGYSFDILLASDHVVDIEYFYSYRSVCSDSLRFPKNDTFHVHSTITSVSSSTDITRPICVRADNLLYLQDPGIMVSSVEVYDILGRLLSKRMLDNSANTCTLSLPTGSSAQPLLILLRDVQGAPLCFITLR